MTKAQKKTKNNKRKVPRGPKRVVRGPTMSGAAQLAALLRDPCNGPVASAYGGEAGIVQRFVQDLTLGTTAGHTCGFAMLSPAGGVILANSRAAPGETFSPASFPGPGAGFLGPNAAKFRPLAACITAMPSAVSFTNLTGEIALANVAMNTIEASGTYTIDGIFQLCNARAVLAKKSYEAKWYPSLMDSTYAPASVAGAGSLTDPSDHNVILLAWRGYPPTVGLSFRFTNVVEWTPRPALGLSVTTTPRQPVPHMDVSAALHRYNPSWWHNLHHDVAGHVAGEVGKGVKALASYGVQQAVRYGMGALPLLMP